MISENDFVKFIKENFSKDKELVFVTQKEPYVHTAPGKDIKEIKVVKPIGGVNVLLDAVLRKTGGTMFALASGDADHLMVDKDDKLQVPPWNPTYTLKRIFLTEKENKGFYYGFSNQTLWPLCHAVFVKPKFHASWWREYVKVNKKFADAIVKEIKGKDAFIWIHDYQFSILPKLIKKQRPDVQIGVFWHIPWPTYEIFRINPWRKEMLEGLLAADFLGFHRGYHIENFLRCAHRDLGAMSDSEPRAAIYKNHSTQLASLPAGVDYDRIMVNIEKIKVATEDPFQKHLKIPRKKEKVVIAAERMDYTKGIIERLKITEKFLDKYRQYKEDIIFVFIEVPSRTSITEYRTYNREVTKLADKINEKFKTETWKPIHLIKHGVPREELFAYYYAADACLVTSLDDGMNLVAKEYVICADAKKGMLLLSKFTGAAKDLGDAMLINPYDTEGSANALFEALNMKPQEKEERNNKMKDTLQKNNIYKWGLDFIQRALK